MSFLAGRLAAKEGSFFLQESKLAAARLAEKLPPSTSGEAVANTSTAVIEEPANVLPEILRHSVPIKAHPAAVSEPSLFTASKWLLKDRYPSTPSSISPDALNPLRSIVSLPQATFGPRRWEFPNEQPTFLASTANGLRRDRYPPINPEKLKAFAKGYSQNIICVVGKAFAAATMIVFGGGTALFVYTAHKLQIKSTEDIRSKGRDLIQPRVDTIREQIAPLRSWVENISKKWRVEGDGKIKEKPPIVKELSKLYLFMERGSSFENSWADQWDYGDDPILPASKNSVGGTKKGVEKTKAMAATGLKKMKQGTTSGFNWIKDKYQKRTQKH